MTGPTRVYPPLDGRSSLTLPETLDFHSKHNPTLPVYVYANTCDSNETTAISYVEFGRACHRVARLVQPNGHLEVVAFIALVDTIVYQAVIVGLMVAGAVVSIIYFLTSAGFKRLEALPHFATQLSGCHRKPT